MQNRADKSTSVFRYLDWTTVIIYLLLVSIGVISIYAASYNFDSASMFSFDEFSGKQIRWIGLGLIMGLVVLLTEARLFETYAYPIYAFMLIVLFITPFIAPDIKGSHSWLDLGFMSLQPAEFAKVATALALAKLFNGYNFVLNAKAANYAQALGFIFAPIILILLQNETGSALVYMSLFFVLFREGMTGLILFAAIFSVTIFVMVVKYTDILCMGIPSGEFIVLTMLMVTIIGMSYTYGKRFDITRNLLFWFTGTFIIEWILAGLCNIDLPGIVIMISTIAIACIYLAIQAIKHHRNKLYIPIATAALSISAMFMVNIAMDMFQPHQKQRINVALGKIEDLRGDGYNVNQSKIAIGSGGFSGKGFLNGTQTKLKYVPEQHTDFIFCTIGEEEGFIGSVVTIGLFLALILRVISLAERQPRPFGRIYGYCVASYLIFHFCINIGMVIGLCPVIGIPLPLISYGGSSLWGFTLLLLILLRLDASRKDYH